MYITRFTRTDGEIEDYLYYTEKEAWEHLELFMNDDSGLYRNISIINNDVYMTVLSILPFQDGIPQQIINAGDIVRLRERYSRPEERKDLYVVKNINESTERVEIQCITTDMILKPIELVGIEMIEKAA